MARTQSGCKKQDAVEAYFDGVRRGALRTYQRMTGQDVSFEERIESRKLTAEFIKKCTDERKA